MSIAFPLQFPCRSASHIYTVLFDGLFDAMRLIWRLLLIERNCNHFQTPGQCHSQATSSSMFDQVAKAENLDVSRASDKHVENSLLACRF